MRYVPNSPAEQAALLKEIGVASVDELFATVPGDVLLKEPPPLGPPMSEIELRRELGAMSVKNAAATCFASFLGAGLYAHHSPAFVSQLLLRGEYLTSYTPYQPEVSQGTLTAIWEFQSHVALLTGLDVANASMYDGATALVEAVLMAERLAKKRTKVVVSRTIHPEYRATLRTYLAYLGLEIVEVPAGADGVTNPAALAAAVDETTFAVAVQSPNVFGLVEDWSVAAETAHGHGALAIGVVNEAFSLALLSPPGAAGVDVACGEAASFGVPVSFGGPTIGFLACRDAYKRQIPGRLAGRLETPAGPVFALTLSTREQHIRREKATSNICSNQGLVALTATMTLTALGKHGLRETALQCLSKAEHLKAGVRALRNGKFAVAFPGATFNEFALRCGPPVDEVLRRLEERQILGGVPFARLEPGSGDHGDLLLVAVTERLRREDLDRYVDVLRGF